MPHIFQVPDYPVFLGNLSEALPGWLQSTSYTQVFLLRDANLEPIASPQLIACLRDAGYPAATGAVVPAGEIHKTLSTCEQIWKSMFGAQLDRRALVVNLGGGVVGDMGGFCAATYKRGIDFIQIPTTLLAMTDAAIGGKLAVDFQGFKNAVGVFRNPAAVFADPAFLQTLPERERRSGFAEVIKHALIGDPELWQSIRQDINHLDDLNWEALLEASIAVKVRVVTEDPFEKGLRAVLNFGHTVGHAVESFFLETHTPLTHGEAVAIGMVCESWLAYGSSPQTDATSAVLRRFFEHRPIPPEIFDHLWVLMQQDKKNASGAVRMSVPDAVPYSMRILEPSREAVAQSLRFYNSV